MAIISKLNDVSCVYISKIDDVLKSNVLYFDDNTFCPQPTRTPTPTPTTTRTPTPTPTQTPTNTPTQTVTPTVTPTVSPTIPVTPTPTETPANTPTPTVTQTQAGFRCVEGHIPKDTEYSYYSCCYPFGQETGTSGNESTGYTVCYYPYPGSTGVTLSSPQVICDTSEIIICCEIQLGYSQIIPDPPCDVGPLETFYISSACDNYDCDLYGALAIYTDEYCTVLAEDGQYSDGTSYGSVVGGVFTFGGPC
jgi:hypothetical protein